MEILNKVVSDMDGAMVPMFVASKIIDAGAKLGITLCTGLYDPATDRISIYKAW